MKLTKLALARISELNQRPGPELRRWQLWLDGQNIDVRSSCIKAIEAAQRELTSLKGRDILGMVEVLVARIGNPKRGTLTARIFGNVRNKANRHSLLVWAVYAVLGKKPLVGWDSTVDVLAYGTRENWHSPTIGDLFTRALDAPAAWTQTAPMLKWMSLGALRLSLEQATDDEWDQALEDWRTIVNALAAWEYVDEAYKLLKQRTDNVRSPELEAVAKAVKMVPLKMIVRMYRQHLIRSMITGFLMQARRSKLKGNVDVVMNALAGLASAVASIRTGELQAA